VGCCNRRVPAFRIDLPSGGRSRQAMLSIPALYVRECLFVIQFLALEYLKAALAAV